MHDLLQDHLHRMFSKRLAKITRSGILSRVPVKRSCAESLQRHFQRDPLSDLHSGIQILRKWSCTGSLCFAICKWRCFKWFGQYGKDFCVCVCCLVVPNSCTWAKIARSTGHLERASRRERRGMGATCPISCRRSRADGVLRQSSICCRCHFSPCSGWAQSHWTVSPRRTRTRTRLESDEIVWNCAL